MEFLKQLFDTYLAGDDATSKFQDRQQQTLELLKEQNKVIGEIQGNIVETNTLMDRFAQKAKIFANFSFMGVGSNFWAARRSKKAKNNNSTWCAKKYGAIKINRSTNRNSRTNKNFLTEDA